MDSKVKQIHISNSINALDNLVFEPVKNLGVSMCLNKIYELYDQVIYAFKSKDEEMEYLDIKRCLVLIAHAQTFNEFNSLQNKVLHKYESLLIPRLEELKQSLDSRYKSLAESRTKPKTTEDKSLFLLLDFAEIRKVDPELSKFVKAAIKQEADPANHLANIGDKNTPYGDSLFSGTPTTNLSIDKPLYLAKSIGILERASRQLQVPHLNFEEFVKRMFYLLKLRKTVKDVDLEMDYILLSRYLSFNEKIRKLPDYHKKYSDNRHLLSKVVIVKNEYEFVKRCLRRKYSSFANAMKLVQHLSLKEKMMQAQLKGIQNRKTTWQVFVKNGVSK